MNKIQTMYVSNPFKIIFDGTGNLFKYNQNLAIILLVASLFMYGGSYIPGNPTSETGTFNPTSEQITIILIVIGVTLIILLPLIIFITTMYSGVAAYTALKTNQQERVTFKQAWNISLNKFWVLLGINIIVGLKVLGGLILFIVPGIRAILRYNMVHFFVFDQNTGVSDSISKSKALAKDHLIEIFGMTFAAGIIPVVGSLMTIGGQSIMYPQLIKLKSAPHEKPAVHWLNYLAFIIFGTFILFSLLITLLVISLIK